jgi:hypothetical protein
MKNTQRRRWQMKIRIKLNELISILIDKNQDPILRKYNLDGDKVLMIQRSLQRGNWKFVS